jgi:hypothetical protein
MLNRSPREMLLRQVALRHLVGVGDRTHEWDEWSGYAYHIRRRLTDDEQNVIGPAIDLRGTSEARERFESIKDALPGPAIRIALEEIRV